ncbi:MAG TPA: hypothetical protein VGO93_21670 [Candidatus Xenobia bacterium]|jgi:hypothetical protein
MQFIRQPGCAYSIRIAKGNLAPSGGPEKYGMRVKMAGRDMPLSIFPNADASAVRAVVYGTDGAFTISKGWAEPALVIEPTMADVEGSQVNVTSSRGGRSTLHLSNQHLGVRLAVALGTVASQAVQRVNELCRQGLVTHVKLIGSHLMLQGEIRTGTAGQQALFGTFRIEFHLGVCRITDPRPIAEIAH